MSSTDGLQGRLGEPPPGEFGDYQAISALAVASLLAGAASATALIGVPLWIVPLVGILLSCLALMRIGRSAGTLIGRPLALAGLGLAVCFGTAAIVAYFNSQRLVARKAQHVASQWFQALAHGEPEVAHQWARAPTNRARLVDVGRLKSYYEKRQNPPGGIGPFRRSKLVAILLRLGPRAHVELESTTIRRIDERLEFVSLVYRVTVRPGR